MVANVFGNRFYNFREPAWHKLGMVSNEQEPDKWQEEFNKLVDSLPDDTLLTIVDCHI